jgi:hypothetical protein
MSMASTAEPTSAHDEARLLGRICDRGDCPAPAAREVVLGGQDFYFCNHHGAELDAVLEGPARVPRELERVG